MVVNYDILIPIVWLSSFITLYVDNYRRALPLRKDLGIGYFKLFRWTTLGPVSHWIKVIFLLVSLAFAPLFLVAHLAWGYKFMAPTLFASAIVLDGLDMDVAFTRAEAHGIDSTLIEQSMSTILRLLEKE